MPLYSLKWLTRQEPGKYNSPVEVCRGLRALTPGRLLPGQNSTGRDKTRNPFKQSWKRMIENYLLSVQKPGRYLANEINAYRKSFEAARVRMALAFPDVYEVGMSHLGVRLLYDVLNQIEGVMADRVYAPWPDFEETLRGRRQVLCGIETQKPLREFDFVGFSLQYELSYTNILTMLELGGIPLLAANRGLGDPWVIGGGPCAFNPEPLADFFDLFILGEAEQALPQLMNLFCDWQSSAGSRQEFLQEARKIPGVYVPGFFEVSYKENGCIREIRPHYFDYTQVTKRVLDDLDKDSPIPDKPLVPLLDIVHNRLGLELARGCTRGCRFCQAGFIYRPVRERHPEKAFARAIEALANSGFEELSLLSLSTGDYCQIQPLLTALMEHFLPRKIAVSFPSMRVGTLTPQLMELVRRVRKTGFTLAPEAGSERLRRVINKGICDEDLLSAAGNAFELGWRVLKLYFMIGLPTETAADLDAMVRLCLEVWRSAKPSHSSVNVSISTFVPKSHTPFQWNGQLDLSSVEERVRELKGRLNRPGLRLKWHDPAHSFLEAVLARGDRRLAAVLLRAWQRGARFDGWSEFFRKGVWDQAFEDCSIDAIHYANRDFELTETLPWEHLSTGVNKQFLLNEYQQALREQYTVDCRFDGCTQCGVCDHRTLKPQLHRQLEERIEAPPVATAPDGGIEHIFRLCYSKSGDMRFYGQLEISQCFSRAIRRAQLPAVMTKGFHPHVKLSFTGALPLGMESMVEEAHLTLSEDLNPCELQSRLNCQLPEGLRVEQALRVVKASQAPQRCCVTYEISRLNSWWTRRILQSWSRRLHDTLKKKTKRGEAEALLGDILLAVRSVSENAIEMDLCEGAQMSFRPAAILGHLLDEPLEVVLACRICKKAISPFTGVEEGNHVIGARYQC
jgi:radical SAM family uncharacterized protein/radical SAM-linked protein